MSIEPKYGILSPDQQAAFDELFKDMPLYQPKRLEMTVPQMTGNKQAYRADGGDIGTDRLREIADNPYGEEEKCWLAKRVLALLDELEAAEKRVAELEAKKVEIKLPESFYPDGDIECPLVINEYQIIEAIVAADCKPIAVCPRCKCELDLSHKHDGAHYCHAAGTGKGE